MHNDSCGVEGLTNFSGSDTKKALCPLEDIANATALLTYLRESRNIRIVNKGKYSMIEVASAEFAKNFGRYKELAQREPLAITSHGRTSGYFVSEHEYAEYQRLKGLSRRVYHISELPEATINVMATARMSPAHDHLNDLMTS